MSDDMDIDEVLDDPRVVETFRQLAREGRERIEKSRLNRRFIEQMEYGAKLRKPTEDLLVMIVAREYAKEMRAWDGQDMFLPIMFALMTVKEISRDR